MIEYHYEFKNDSFKAVDYDSGIVTVLQANFVGVDDTDSMSWSVTIRAKDLPITEPVTPIALEDITLSKAEQWLDEYLLRQPHANGYLSLRAEYEDHIKKMIEREQVKKADNIAAIEAGTAKKDPITMDRLPRAFSE